jgi:hypothetical protein
MSIAFKSLPFVFAVLSIFSLVGCSQNKTEATPGIHIIDHNLNIHSFTGDVLKSIAAVDGRIKNSSNDPINSASIIVKYFDKDGNLLYTGSTIQQNIQPEEIRIFNVQFSNPDAWKTVRYDISITVP